MGNACSCFKYSPDEGMKAFSITEMFIGVFNFIVGICYWEVVLLHFGRDETRRVVAGICSMIFAITMMAQGILAFVLHFLGWKKGNRLVCLIWIIVAACNLILPWLVTFIAPTEADSSAIVHNLFLFYLNYIIYGIWIVESFRKDLLRDHTVHTTYTHNSGHDHYRERDYEYE